MRKKALTIFYFILSANVTNAVGDETFPADMTTDYKSEKGKHIIGFSCSQYMPHSVVNFLLNFIA